MQIRISTRHGVISDETHERITAKVDKLARLFERLMDIEVEVDLERREQPIVELKVSAEHKHDFVARYQSEDLLGSVDQVVHKVEQQLRKYKQKIQDHHRSPSVRQMEVPGDLGPATS